MPHNLIRKMIVAGTVASGIVGNAYNSDEGPAIPVIQPVPKQKEKWPQYHKEPGGPKIRISTPLDSVMEPQLVQSRDKDSPVI